MGIPVLQRLRWDPRLRDAIRIWPFETGLAPPAAWPMLPPIIFAEVCPSLIPLPSHGHPVKDARQVTSMAAHLAEADLSQAFAGPTLDPVTRHVIESEEGWILLVE